MKTDTTKIELIIEKEDDHFWGRVEGKGFMPTGQGETISDLVKNVKDSIEDYIQHEGKEDNFWSLVNVDDLKFDITYDLEAFFKEHDYLKISSIGKKAKMSASLLRQYASGVKKASAEQAKRVEEAIHQIATELRQVSIC